MTSPWLRELAPATRFIFQGDAAARQIAAAAWTVGFSELACRALATDERATLWLGPDEYLLWHCSREASSQLAQTLGHALLGIAHSLVDVSHRQMAWEITGPRAENLLNGGCPLDLSPEAFPVGMCTRTAFAKADIVLWRKQPEVFHLEAWRSFAPYVTGLLREIATDSDP